MTQENKELLLKDLCARMPYSVKVKLGDNPNIFDLEYRIKFAVIYDENGDPAKFVGILTDVDKEKKEKTRLISQAETDQLTGFLQVLQAGLHIHDDHVVLAEDQAGQDRLEHHVLGADAAGTAGFHRAHHQQLHAVDFAGIGVGYIADLRIQLVDSPTSQSAARSPMFHGLNGATCY